MFRNTCKYFYRNFCGSFVWVSLPLQHLEKHCFCKHDTQPKWRCCTAAVVSFEPRFCSWLIHHLFNSLVVDLCIFLAQDSKPFFLAGWWTAEGDISLTSFLVSDVNKHSLLPLSLAAPTAVTAASLWPICVVVTAIKRAALINCCAFCSSLLYKGSCVSREAPQEWLSAKYSSNESHIFDLQKEGREGCTIKKYIYTCIGLGVLKLIGFPSFRESLCSLRWHTMAGSFPGMS